MLGKSIHENALPPFFREIARSLSGIAVMDASGAGTVAIGLRAVVGVGLEGRAQEAALAGIDLNVPGLLPAVPDSRPPGCEERTEVRGLSNGFSTERRDHSYGAPPLAPESLGRACGPRLTIMITDPFALPGLEGPSERLRPTRISVLFSQRRREESPRLAHAS
jgi:hypothetical protein